MAQINLGRIQPIDRGVYSPTYEYKKLDFVTAGDGSSYYTCIQDAPVGTPVTSTQYFRKVIESVGDAVGVFYDNSTSELAASNVQAAIDEITGDYYNTGNIVGAVSQIGGVPTGALVEVGGDAVNGWYWKYAGGMMIIIAPLPDFDGTSQPVLAAGEIRDYAAPGFVEPFSEAPKVFAKVQPNATTDCYGVLYTHEETPFGFNMVFRNGDIISQGFVNNYYVATGRWYN